MGKAMKRLLGWAMVLGMAAALPAAAQDDAQRVYFDVPDGQFISHVITVYTTEKIDWQASDSVQCCCAA